MKFMNLTSFIAKEIEKGLLIKPILNDENVIFYDTEEEFGVYFQKGIDPEFLKYFK